jgi:hypothetical protein
MACGVLAGHLGVGDALGNGRTKVKRRKRKPFPIALNLSACKYEVGARPLSLSDAPGPNRSPLAPPRLKRTRS